MGVAYHSIRDLIHTLRSWVGGISGVFVEPWMWGGGGGRPACCECRAFLAAPTRGLRCRSCNRVFCWECMQSTEQQQQPPKFCRFCLRAIVGPGEAVERRGGEKVGTWESPDLTPRSPLSRSSDHKPTQMVESRQFSSPRSLCCSAPSRSDDEEEGDESVKNYFSPLSEFSQDVSDIDSVSISTGNELYGFKSVASSPLDSPSRAFEQGDVSPLSGTTGMFEHYSPDCLRKTGADAEDLLEHSNSCTYGSVSAYRDQETQNAQQQLDFENNGLIWYPPSPEDEGDDAENGFIRFDDDDDGVGESGEFFSASSFGSEAKEKSNVSQKELLRNAVCGHFRALVSQLLKGEGIHVGNENAGEGWLEVVSSLAWEAANFVKPDTSRGGSMDPGDYVKVKCIASGRPSESTLIKGVVCTKNVKHKRMVSQHKSPRLFLLGGALEYQKVPNKLASINTVLEQETEHLKVAVGRIEAHRPNVLLVEKTVSSYAQQDLLAKEISLVLNVKRPLLERIARCTGARIAPSIDNVASARVGQCEMFHVERVFEESSSVNNSNKRSSKTLMFFEGCPRRLGCTVLLRGTCREELKRVKHVVQFASFAAYHLSLETSFLADEGAMLPKIPLGSPVTFHMKEMNSESSVSTFSSLSCPETCQMTTGNHLTGGLCGDVGINCLSKSSNGLPLNKNESRESKSTFNNMNSGDVLSLPLAHYQNSRKSIVGSTTNIPGLKGSIYGFHSKELRRSSHLSGDVSIYQCEEVEESIKGSSLTSGRHLLSDDEHKNTDIDEGNEVPNEYFATAENHQSILVSLSSTCVLKGTVCEPSQLFRIKFYGSFDKPLGRYLRDDLFNQTSCCQSCKEPAEAHIRCYTHQHGSLTISVRRLSSMKLPGERDGRIWMWHRCLKCELKDGVPPAARRVVMSDAAWGLSFGKFLELSFSNHATANRIASCGHSLQKDCLRFYGHGSMVAVFRYSPVDILSVSLPPSMLDLTCQTRPEWVTREAAAILRNMESLHEEISDVLNGFERKITTSENEPLKMSIHKCITELKDLLESEKHEYEVFLEPLAIENSQPIQTSVDILELNRLRRGLLIDGCMWDRRLCLLDSFSKAKSDITQFDSQFPEVLSDDNMNENRAEFVDYDVKLGNPPQVTTTKSSNLLGTPRKSLLSKQHDESSLQILECNSNNLVEMDFSIESVEGYVGPAGLNLFNGHYNGLDEKQAGAEASSDAASSENVLSPASSLSDKIDLAWTGSGQIVTDTLKDGLLVESVGSLSLLENPIHRKAMSPIRVHSFDSALKFRDRIHSGLGRASLHLSTVRSFDTSGGFASMTKDPVPNMQVSYPQRSPRTKQRLNMLLNHRPTYISSISRMLSDGARFLLPQTTLDIVIAIYDDEPSSIISHAMTSQEYTEFITSKLDQPGLNGKEKTGIDNQMGYCTGATSSAVQRCKSDDTPYRGYGSDEPQPLRESLSDPKEAHFRISFDDESSYHADKVKFSVTCYFAKQFDALRRKCCPNEWDYIRSLCRCKRWSAQGGKSNVYFAKTLDERFIIKQVTKTELDSFEEFAPEYFKYLTDSITSGSPTCLAKILGIYQVTAKHMKGGREVKMDLMVMENIFFRRNISRVYDLKGSLRSRYNPDTSGNNKVLLDLNLLETLRTKPIFLGSKAKRSLERAVWNDTSFLASVDVMDYSLLVGINEEQKELVIGIIDFMRQYTWDKHLETWVKAAGILGGPKNASPTVVSPIQYKKRFRKAMSKYFPIVPDQWSS